MTGARCGAQTTETGSDGGEITFVCLLPAARWPRWPAARAGRLPGQLNPLARPGPTLARRRPAGHGPAGRSHALAHASALCINVITRTRSQPP
jgi:hypothetical protein